VYAIKHNVFVFTHAWSLLQASLLLVISPRPPLAVRASLSVGHSQTVAPKLNV
jgi:hypothetical protein